MHVIKFRKHYIGMQRFEMIEIFTWNSHSFDIEIF